MRPFKNILIPTDYSECADHAASYAGDLASALGARLVVLHVAPPQERTVARYTTVGEEQEESQLKAYAAKLVGRQARTYDTEMIWGDPAQCIVDVARARGTDLIVMGTHGRTGWDRLVIGSVAEKVVRYAPCAVLTVRLPAARSKKASRRKASRRVARKSAAASRKHTVTSRR